MNSRKNTKLTARGREEMVRRLAALSAGSVASDCGMCVRTGRKWKYEMPEDTAISAWIPHLSSLIQAFMPGLLPPGSRDAPQLQLFAVS